MQILVLSRELHIHILKTYLWKTFQIQNFSNRVNHCDLLFSNLDKLENLMYAILHGSD
jgi:hypothetical protein